MPIPYKNNRADLESAITRAFDFGPDAIHLSAFYRLLLDTETTYNGDDMPEILAAVAVATSAAAGLPRALRVMAVLDKNLTW